mmetsp:Transcript_48930/g.106240  ORF Transcript_48930/g.106240 Transcript_48930/m.106240 type:complete len:676 (+) Transcript_48930:620-2647(+)
MNVAVRAHGLALQPCCLGRLRRLYRRRCRRWRRPRSSSSSSGGGGGTARVDVAFDRADAVLGVREEVAGALLDALGTSEEPALAARVEVLLVLDAESTTAGTAISGTATATPARLLHVLATGHGVFPVGVEATACGIVSLVRRRAPADAAVAVVEEALLADAGQVMAAGVVTGTAVRTDRVEAATALAHAADHDHVEATLLGRRGRGLALLADAILVAGITLGASHRGVRLGRALRLGDLLHGCLLGLGSLDGSTDRLDLVAQDQLLHHAADHDLDRRELVQVVEVDGAEVSTLPLVHVHGATLEVLAPGLATREEVPAAEHADHAGVVPKPNDELVDVKATHLLHGGRSHGADSVHLAGLDDQLVENVVDDWVAAAQDGSMGNCDLPGELGREGTRVDADGMKHVSVLVEANTKAGLLEVADNSVRVLAVTGLTDVVQGTGVLGVGPKEALHHLLHGLLGTVCLHRLLRTVGVARRLADIRVAHTATTSGRGVRTTGLLGLCIGDANKPTKLELAISRGGLAGKGHLVLLPENRAPAVDTTGKHLDAVLANSAQVKALGLQGVVLLRVMGLVAVDGPLEAGEDVHHAAAGATARDLQFCEELIQLLAVLLELLHILHLGQALDVVKSLGDADVGGLRILQRGALSGLGSAKLPKARSHTITTESAPFSEGGNLK